MNETYEPRPPAKPTTVGPLPDFKDRVVIMSGGSRGIALAIAKALASEGAKVAIIAKRFDLMQQINAAAPSC